MGNESAARAALEAEGIRKSFRTGREQRVILDGAAIRVNAGEWVAVTGPSGVGKTTLLHVLAGILPPESGRVAWSGTDIFSLDESKRDKLRAESAGLVFQFHHLLPDLTVEENIRLAVRLAGHGWPVPDIAPFRTGCTKNGAVHVGDARAGARDGVREMIDRLGLGNFSRERIETLSGGERQRVAVARALVHRPRILFADEPTGNLDELSAMGVLDIFEDACRQFGAAVILSTHNPAVSARAARRLELRGGKLVQM